MEQFSQPPKRLTLFIVMWILLSLVGGTVYGIWLIDPANAFWKVLLPNIAQAGLFLWFLDYGRRFLSARQLLWKMLPGIILLLVAPILLVAFLTTGEIPAGIIGLIILFTVTLPQLLLTLNYFVVRRVLQKFSTRTIFIVSFLFHLAALLAFALWWADSF